MVISDAEPTGGRRFRSIKNGRRNSGRQRGREDIYHCRSYSQEQQRNLNNHEGEKILRENKLDELRDLGV